MLYCCCRGCHGFWSVSHLQNERAGFAKHLPGVWHLPSPSLRLTLSCIPQCCSSCPPLPAAKKNWDVQGPLRKTSAITRYIPTRNWSRRGEETMWTYRAVWGSIGEAAEAAEALPICRSLALWSFLFAASSLWWQKSGSEATQEKLTQIYSFLFSQSFLYEKKGHRPQTVPCMIDIQWQSFSW